MVDIRTHVTALTASGPRHDTDAGVAHALAYISGQLRSFGYPVIQEPYGANRPCDVNVLAEITGANPHAIELGAHWDTVRASPGADDNASGVAGVLRAAETLAVRGTPARTVRFCFFGGEEQNCVGSFAHVPTISQETGSIILEMIGFKRTGPNTQRFPAALAAYTPPTTGDFIALIGKPRAEGYMAAVHAAAGPHGLSTFQLTVPIDGSTEFLRSDHMPYWSTNRASLLVTDTADYRNANYHLPSDTADTLDYTFAEQVAAAVTGAVSTLAGPWT
jgi:aminopeptidase YwaD